MGGLCALALAVLPLVYLSFERVSQITRTAASIAEALKAQKMFSSREWRKLYSDGTAIKWLQQVSDFFMTEAGVTTAMPATDYFDSSLYQATVN